MISRRTSVLALVHHNALPGESLAHSVHHPISLPCPALGRVVFDPALVLGGSAHRLDSMVEEVSAT